VYIHTKLMPAKNAPKTARVSLNHESSPNARGKYTRSWPCSSRRRLHRVVLAVGVGVHGRRLVFNRLFIQSGRPFDEANPPRGRFKRAVVVVQRGVDVVEVIPD
jgi:hypothetical protein